MPFVSSVNLRLADGATRNQVNITADDLTVGGMGFRSVSLTANITTAGANGLDTGTEAVNTWYAVHAITSATGSLLAALLSLSATAPTLPAGYTLFRRVGWVRNNSASDLFRFINAADDHWFFYNEDLFASPFLVVNTTAAPTIFTDVDCSAVAPSTSRMVMLGGDTFDSAVAVTACYTRSNDLPNVTANPPSMALYQEINPAPTGVQRAGGNFFQPIDSSQIFEYRGQVATNDIRLAVLGYRDVR